MGEPANGGEHAEVEAKRELFRLIFARWDTFCGNLAFNPRARARCRRFLPIHHPY
jgi:hypothetical protein